jgi:hypothetical protein
MTARTTTLTAATRRTVRALRRAGSLEADVDSLVVATCLFTAGRLDDLDAGTSAAQVASLTRAHLAATRLLLGRGEESDDSGLSEVIAALSMPPVDAPIPDDASG